MKVSQHFHIFFFSLLQHNVCSYSIEWAAAGLWWSLKNTYFENIRVGCGINCDITPHPLWATHVPLNLGTYSFLFMQHCGSNDVAKLELPINSVISVTLWHTLTWYSISTLHQEVITLYVMSPTHFPLRRWFTFPRVATYTTLTLTLSFCFFCLFNMSHLYLSPALYPFFFFLATIQLCR